MGSCLSVTLVLQFNLKHCFVQPKVDGTHLQKKASIMFCVWNLNVYFLCCDWWILIYLWIYFSIVICWWHACLFPFHFWLNFRVFPVDFAVLALQEQATPAVLSVPTNSTARHFPTSVLLQEQRDDYRPFLHVSKEDRISKVRLSGNILITYIGISIMLACLLALFLWALLNEFLNLMAFPVLYASIVSAYFFCNL